MRTIAILILLSAFIIPEAFAADACAFDNIADDKDAQTKCLHACENYGGWNHNWRRGCNGSGNNSCGCICGCKGAVDDEGHRPNC